jgi:hypothetical protein
MCGFPGRLNSKSYNYIVRGPEVKKSNLRLSLSRELGACFRAVSALKALGSLNYVEAISKMPNGPISVRPAVLLKTAFSRTA